MFVFKYSYKKEGKIRNYSIDRMRNFAHCWREICETRYDIDPSDWIDGSVYENDELIGKIDYYGGGTFIIDGKEIHPYREDVYRKMMLARSKEEIVSHYKNGGDI